MTDDYFAPPEVSEFRHKPQQCKSPSDEGERCDLYRDHYGNHKDKTRRKEWA